MKINNHRLIADQNEPFSFQKSPNQSQTISPLYLVIHYTAGSSLEGAVNWFLNPQAQASAHLVIGRDGTVVQMVDFNKKAWHAGKSIWGNLEGLNSYSIGIELVNSGRLSKRSDGQWVNWAKNIIPDDQVTIATHKDETEANGWHEYSDQQIQCALNIATLLNHHYKFTDVLGHEDIAPKRKADPGPLFPMNSFRSHVLGRNG